MVFRDFFELEFNDFEYLDEWNRVNVEVTDMPIIDFVWSSKSQLLITLHKPTQTKKSTFLVTQSPIFSNPFSPNNHPSMAVFKFANNPQNGVLLLQSLPRQNHMVYNTVTKVGCFS